VALGSAVVRTSSLATRFRAAILTTMGERMILEIGTITLDWSDWAPWTALLADARGGAGVPIPNGQPGVYEVKRSDHAGDERLYIGKASDLRMRVRQAW
jgi:hypothetical protein